MIGRPQIKHASVCRTAVLYAPTAQNAWRKLERFPMHPWSIQAQPPYAVVEASAVQSFNAIQTQTKSEELEQAASGIACAWQTSSASLRAAQELNPEG
jgi:hypothetical protein